MKLLASLICLVASTINAQVLVKANVGYTATDKYVIQKQDSVAIVSYGGNITLNGFGVSQGGIIVEHGTPFCKSKLDFKNIYSTGQLNDNNKEPGCFLAITADSGCESVSIDNTGLASYLKKKGLDPSVEWIQQGKAEAALRFMDVQYVTLKGLKVRCSTHWNNVTHRVEPYKQAAQMRSQRGPGGKWLVIDSEFDGPVTNGRQALPGGLFQHIDEITYENCIFRYWPLDRQPGVGKLIFKNCKTVKHDSLNWLPSINAFTRVNYDYRAYVDKTLEVLPDFIQIN